MIGATLALFVGGCAAPQGGRPQASAATAARPAPAPLPVAEPTSVPEPTPSPTPPPRAADPGSIRVIDAMRAAIDEYAPGRRETIRVEAWRLRNFSHAAPREFAAMRRRLCELLSAAGARAAPRIEFVDAEEGPVEFELHGTAYLLNADGFDQWELFLTLRPARDRWTVWEAAAPLRLLRNQRPVDGLLPGLSAP